MEPTLAGFRDFIANVMQIPSSALDVTAPVVGYCYSAALDTVNTQLQLVPASDPAQPSLYAKAVYNCAGDLLVNAAQDGARSTYFSDLRAALNINGFAGGVITGTSDQATSTTIAVSQALQNLTIGQLQAIKTPWGRAYLQIAQSVGTNWGLT